MSAQDRDRSPASGGGAMFRGWLTASRARWRPLTIYQRFEDAVVIVLTFLIAVIILAALWALARSVWVDELLALGEATANLAKFQTIFAMIFTVIIALEFERSLLVLTKRGRSIVQVRTVVLIALLAVLRKMILTDLGEADALMMFALAAAILSLGLVYWLARDQDRRQGEGG
jgi:uncharacterized membrane protein (DUF373 family)